MLENLFRLDNKIIIITGATGLLGRKHAEAIAHYGGIPILLDLSQQLVDNFASELNDKFQVNSVGYGIDITDEESIANNAELIIKKFGKIDGLINNAANNPKVEDGTDINFSRLENFPIDIWNDDLNVGLTGSFLCAKHYGFVISNNKNGGTIVNISSDLGLIAPDQRLYKVKGLSEDKQPVKPVTYSVIKAGLIGLTRYLATYWPENGVRANALSPGGVYTDQDSEFVKRLTNLIPMGRMAKSDEYISAIQFLCSDASAYMNGQNIVMDGGRSVL